MYQRSPRRIPSSVGRRWRLSPRLKNNLSSGRYRQATHELRTYRVTIHPVIVLSTRLNAFSSDPSMYRATQGRGAFQAGGRILFSVELSASASWAPRFVFSRIVGLNMVFLWPHPYLTNLIDRQPKHTACTASRVGLSRLRPRSRMKSS